MHRLGLRDLSNVQQHRGVQMMMPDEVLFGLLKRVREHPILELKQIRTLVV